MTDLVLSSNRRASKRSAWGGVQPLRWNPWMTLGCSLVFIMGTSAVGFAMPPQIPTLQVCNATKIEARAKVHIGNREDSAHPGTFGVQMEVACDPRSGFPRGKVEIVELHMTDSLVHGMVLSATIDQVTSTGARSPMAFLSGRCRVRHVGPVPVDPVDDLFETPSLDAASTRPVDIEPIPLPPTPVPNPFRGCRFWMTLADNREGDNAFGADQTADVIGFLVINGRGRRLAHGMGPVASGEVRIAPSRD